MFFFSFSSSGHFNYLLSDENLSDKCLSNFFLKLMKAAWCFNLLVFICFIAFYLSHFAVTIDHYYHCPTDISSIDYWLAYQFKRVF